MPIAAPKVDTVLTSPTDAKKRVSFTVQDGTLGGSFYPSDRLTHCIIKLAGNHSARGLKKNEEWLMFRDHWDIPANAITSIKVTPAKESDRKVFVPGAAIDWSDPDCMISTYFSVLEATKADPARMPRSGSLEEQNIIRIARELDKIREEWKSPIGVTSWYRPPAINAMVGGVSNSQHINGAAVDVYTMDGREWDFENFLDRNWGGGLGYGVASGRGFTHLDTRGGGWKHGNGAIRWNY